MKTVICERCGNKIRILPNARAQHAKCPKKEIGKILPRYIDQPEEAQ